MEQYDFSDVPSPSVTQASSDDYAYPQKQYDFTNEVDPRDVAKSSIHQTNYTQSLQQSGSKGLFNDASNLVNAVGGTIGQAVTNIGPKLIWESLLRVGKDVEIEGNQFYDYLTGEDKSSQLIKNEEKRRQDVLNTLPADVRASFDTSAAMIPTLATLPIGGAKTAAKGVVGSLLTATGTGIKAGILQGQLGGSLSNDVGNLVDKSIVGAITGGVITPLVAGASMAVGGGTSFLKNYIFARKAIKEEIARSLIKDPEAVAKLKAAKEVGIPLRPDQVTENPLVADTYRTAAQNPSENFATNKVSFDALQETKTSLAYKQFKEAIADVPDKLLPPPIKTTVNLLIDTKAGIDKVAQQKANPYYNMAYDIELPLSTLEELYKIGKSTVKSPGSNIDLGDLAENYFGPQKAWGQAPNKGTEFMVPAKQEPGLIDTFLSSADYKDALTRNKFYRGQESLSTFQMFDEFQRFLNKNAKTSLDPAVASVYQGVANKIQDTLKAASPEYSKAVEVIRSSKQAQLSLFPPKLQDLLLDTEVNMNGRVKELFTPSNNKDNLEQLSQLRDLFHITSSGTDTWNAVAKSSMDSMLGTKPIKLNAGSEDIYTGKDIYHALYGNKNKKEYVDTLLANHPLGLDFVHKFFGTLQQLKVNDSKTLSAISKNIPTSAKSALGQAINYFRNQAVADIFFNPAWADEAQSLALKLSEKSGNSEAMKSAVIHTISRMFTKTVINNVGQEQTANRNSAESTSIQNYRSNPNAQ